MKIAVILGTRPEIIKMSPIVRECMKQNLNTVLAKKEIGKNRFGDGKAGRRIVDTLESFE
jgi:UDP-N-acetylglucosamine 2-epimerase